MRDMSLDRQFPVPGSIRKVGLPKEQRRHGVSWCNHVYLTQLRLSSLDQDTAAGERLPLK
jgi:hypothetical protein